MKIYFLETFFFFRIEMIRCAEKKRKKVGPAFGYIGRPGPSCCCCFCFVYFISFRFHFVFFPIFPSVGATLFRVYPSRMRNDSDRAHQVVKWPDLAVCCAAGPHRDVISFLSISFLFLLLLFLLRHLTHTHTHILYIYLYTSMILARCVLISVDLT